MKNKVSETSISEQNSIAPFSVAQALVALEMGSTDTAILSYFNYLSDQLPIEVASFIHVVPEANTYPVLGEEFPFGLSERFVMDEKITREMKEKVEALVSPKEQLNLTYALKEGNPLEQLLQNAEELQADLLVIGQKSGTRQHGILAKNLARKATTNALIIPENAQNALHTILIPVDFSPNSGRALQTAVALNKQLRNPAKLICLYLFELPDFSTYRINRLPEQVRSMIKEEHLDGMNRFIETHAREAKEIIEIAVIEKDMPATAQYIYEFAEDCKADFIVMGAKGHSKVHLLFLGSVTEKLMNLNEQFPTLIVR